MVVARRAKSVDHIEREKNVYRSTSTIRIFGTYSRSGPILNLSARIGAAAAAAAAGPLSVSPDEAEQGQSTVPRMVGEAEGVALVNRR